MGVWLTRVRRRIRAIVSRTHDREVRDELELHLDLLAEEYAAQGLSPADARARAQRDFGNATQIQETIHDLVSFRAWEQLSKDVSYAIREVRRSPWFTAVAILSLAIGIAAVTTTASVVDALLLRRLPVHEPDRLVEFTRGDAATGARWRHAELRWWADASHAPFTVAAEYNLNQLERPLLPAADGEARRGARVTLVSGEYFEVLGVALAAGRAISPDDDRVPGQHAVAVISHAFWVARFGQAPDVLGRTLTLNDVPYDVIGVAPKSFTGDWVGEPTEVWLPLAMHAAATRSRAALLRDDAPARWLRLIGRLEEGTSAAEASAAANAIRRHAAEAVMGQALDEAEREPVVLVSAATGYAPMRAQYARPLTMVSVVVAIVLVVACVNFSNLLYARSRSRRQEYAVRLALGASRGRILRQALVECLLLASMSAALGVIGAAWATTGAFKILAASLQPMEVDLHLDARVLSVTAACTALVILCGLASSVRWLNGHPVSLAPSNTRGQRRDAISRLFLAGQLALCVVLLIGTGLMLRTVVNLRTQQLGFDRHVVLVTVAPAQAGYAGDAAGMLVQRIRERLLALPDIRNVSTAAATPMDSRTYWVDRSERLVVDGRTPMTGASWTFTDVGADFFRTMGMPIRRGREFTHADVDSRSDVVIVNESMARLLFGAEDPLGRLIGSSATAPKHLVVGIVTDARQTSPRDRGLPVLYRPLRRVPPQIMLAVRARDDGAAAVDLIRHQLLDIDRDLPIVNVQTVEALLERTIGQERLLASLATWLGLLVVAVSCVGLHALIANDVTARLHELGVRLALGASRVHIAGLVLRDAAILAALALSVGVPLSLAAVSPVSSQLYGVQPNDPRTILIAALMLTCVVMLAAGSPARKAARLNPVDLLRAD